MKTAAIIALSVAGTLAVTGTGYGLYQAGASQNVSVETMPLTLSETDIDSRVAMALQAALQEKAEQQAVQQQPVASTAAVGTAQPQPIQTPVSRPVVVTPVAQPIVQHVAQPVFQPAQQARVLHAEPLTTSWQEPREVCQQVTIQKRAQRDEKTQVAGTLLGAAAGGLLGNQIGGGSGKKVATVIGALAGAQVGKQSIQGSPRTYTSTQQQCHTVMETRTRTTDYLVSYELYGQLQTIRTTKDPGSYLLVENGRVVAF